MNGINMEEQLKPISANVNDWLKFAETKNAAIIAADAAAALGALAVLISNTQNLKTWFYFYLYNFIIFLLLSGLIALISVIPKTNISLAKPKENRMADDNLLFYGDIAKYDPKEYLTEMRGRYGKTETEITGLEIDYAEQIVINSQIALRKFDIFRAATWLAVAAIITPILAIILFYSLNWEPKK